MDIQNKIEIIMKDGSTALASDHMDKLIASEVANTIAQIDDAYDLSKRADIQELSEMIVDHLTRNTHLIIDPKIVMKEFRKQLKFH
ncbi:hypothetical protein LZZ98_04755 [Acinetobacter sp. SM34]|uniref:hypothetical protein n=1 Tax=Acinetobacter sp. SM34 TaxID=1301620 RepID=UPI001EDC3D09|nr:hypothetical protein [Acinetobacter sp. SM34]MCG2607848.1 hypothetical protein [Acinetobacter sp. SM34]